VSYIDGGALAEGVSGQGAEEDICSQEVRGDKGVEELHDLYLSPNIIRSVK
jgi:hypothetical protein